MGEPIAESRVVGEPIVALEKCTATFFPPEMYGYILESRVVGEPIAESRVVGEPIIAWKNVLLHFSPQNVRVHFGITSSGRTYR